MPRRQLFTGLYACPICQNEFELYRAWGAELVCPTCREELEPVLDGDLRPLDAQQIDSDPD
jgi:hypothetical protein